MSKPALKQMYDYDSSREQYLRMRRDEQLRNSETRKRKLRKKNNKEIPRESVIDKFYALKKKKNKSK